MLSKRYGKRYDLARIFAMPARAVAMLCCLALAACSDSSRMAGAGAPPEARQSAPAAPVPTVELPSFVTLVKKEGPAVVNISATQTIRGSADMLEVPEDDPLFDFFRRFMPPP